MKKLIFILCMIIGVASVQAQVVVIPPASLTSATFGQVADTIDAASAQYMVSGNLPPAIAITAVATVTKITGTLTGTLTLQGTIDGTNWVNVGDTVWTVADASASYKFNVADYPYTKFRVSATGGSGPQYAIRVKIYGVRRQ
jgi:regulator of protease activity HflC (stomatin/prohibitin superfamily)